MANELILKMDQKSYFDHDSLNHSSLKNLFPPSTPSDFLWHLNHQKKPSEAMDFGSAVHIAMFEHESFDDRVVVAPTLDRRSKSGKEEYESFLKSVEGKLILTQEQLDNCYSILEQAQKHKILRHLLSQKHKVFEASGFFTYKDVNCKFRTDFMLPDDRIILDLKTTKSAHERAFMHSVHEYHYHSQAAFYLLGMQHITGCEWRDFLWIAVESNPPFKIYVYEPSTTWLIHGMMLIDDAIDLYKKCRDSRFWPSVKDEIFTLPTPSWLSIEE